MTTRTQKKKSDFNSDLIESLKDSEYLEHYLNEVLESYYEDKNLDLLLHCLKPVIESQGTIKDFADRANIRRTYLYRLFNCQVHPEFNTLMNIFEALGLTMRFSLRKRQAY